MKVLLFALFMLQVVPDPTGLPTHFDATMQYDFSSTADGLHNLSATARDWMDIKGDSAPIVIYVNNRPQVQIVTPTPGLVVSKSTPISAKGIPVAKGETITMMDLQIDGKIVGTSLTNTMTGTFNPVPKNIALGPHTITVRAWDSKKRQGEASVIVYKMVQR